MKEMTPVAGTTFLDQFFVWKISTSLLFDKALSWVLSNVKMSSPCPKINRKCFGWNAIYGNEFGDFSSVFGSIWHVDYVCSYEKGWKTNVRDSYINPGVYLIHAYCSTLQHKNQRLFHGMSDLKDFIFSLRSTRSLAAPIEKSEIKHLKKKRKNGIHLPSWYIYWG